MRKAHWIKGDCHLHTTNSDGAKRPEELYEALYRKGLDFAFITDKIDAELYGLFPIDNIK